MTLSADGPGLSHTDSFQHPAPKVLIANRGEIARRVIRTCKHHGIDTIAVYTQVDALAPHVREATQAVCLGNKPRSYTDATKLLQVIKEYGATAVHPGYGFLSENEEFCAAVEDAGVKWLGPTAKTMHDFALKHVAREIAEAAGVPVLKGSGLVSDPEEAVAAAEEIGFPVLLKATGGGGGRGIYICHDVEEVRSQFHISQKQGEAFFGNSGVFVEKYIQRCHHIEVQIFGDGQGKVVHLGERECSIQRRHQKVLEETPSPLLTDALRGDLTSAACRLGAAASYRSAGTVEFIFDEDESKFYFLEVNTRLQVEHGITELVNGGVDLVEWMLRLQLPGMEPLDLDTITTERSGHSIEVRINGENPAKDFQPCPGILGEVAFPFEMDGVRVDTWVETGTEVSPYYDSMLAKLMVYAPTREAAIAKMAEAIAATRLQGVPNNLEFLGHIVKDPRFIAGSTTTSFLEAVSFKPHVMEVVLPGLQTSVQDYPGRVGLWRVGVSPSGPMDALSHRLANALVGNEEDAAALEFGLTGPTIKFHCDGLVALAGAEFDVTLDDEPVAWWSSFKVAAGQELRIGAVHPDSGVRGYLAVAGGVDVPKYLGSRSTFPGGKFGGYQGRYLNPGDSLPIGATASDAAPTALPKGWLDQYAGAVQVAPGTGAGEPTVVGVLPGPHANPDYFTDDAMDVFYSSPYEVHYNSNRLGVRLNGPRPTWTRTDGGEGGSHPSNVHDHTYAIGTVNFTGDMPVILMVDGPSLGGFVCAATIPSSELWKVGQVRPNDNITFKQITIEEAYVAALRTDALMAAVKALSRGKMDAKAAAASLDGFEVTVPKMPETKAVLVDVAASDSHPGYLVRLAGDRYVQLEYGPMELDLSLRARIHALEKELAALSLAGLVETSAGVRSVMIEYDQRALVLPDLLDAIARADGAIGNVAEMVLPSRIVHLPMAFDERWTHEALERYAKSARPEAPYLPSNIQYIANNNGLEGKEDVRRIVFEASYLVLGLGDVYLGAPCAVPVNPLHRLVTAKFNPARTFTHEGTVGIGGSYMCIYPMDSPGGYQLVGRTLPIWNTFGRTRAFTPEKPWLLEFFDQVRFFQVSEDELENLRERFAAGQYDISIESKTFSMADYTAMITEPEMVAQWAAWKAQQRAASEVQLQLEEESLARLEAARAANGTAQEGSAQGGSKLDTDPAWDGPGCTKVCAGFTASVWDIKVKEGDTVAKGDTVVVLEAMKMESPVVAPVAGTIKAIVAEQGAMAAGGQLLLVIEVAAPS
ncbi:UreA carboxylase [Monoraphidium neglectum]|uniref:UreA carboxylase n=1 Tax=Monoraphidium neglectum TaxID=145388 RepID=A0A0D2MW19_9CHLO|nr:UreA carboxylase [Monoraphidium neglectum]KIZ06735.1 UreA carboxylase [Monoraphidium neglectum]|eukprot:XP_013905754.1 UreA carboxylase [Monoraphidium neglectum]